MKIVAFILTFSIVFVFSKTTPTTLITEAQMNQSSIQLQNETRKSGGSCNYKVNIKTSCNSPPHTTDEISILFGDNNASEVYVQRLNDPDSGTTFEQCTTIEFEILGPCIGKICKMYLFRNGTDGWIPETVTAYHYDYPPVIFNYNIDIPQDAGYGYNNCK
ncbi:unnamed protein product [Lathyrus oleraceus]|uniref:Uncharacterized protein n=1 Tax=Pisum sativum TaxID=3888 RepID=A0A9D5AQ16_PEA|nr:hypothetical protein KIW84_058283 [Pisum sativum]